MKNKKIQQSEIIDIELKIIKFFHDNAIKVLDKKNNGTTKDFISLITQNIN